MKSFPAQVPLLGLVLALLTSGCPERSPRVQEPQEDTPRSAQADGKTKEPSATEQTPGGRVDEAPNGAGVPPINAETPTSEGGPPSAEDGAAPSSPWDSAESCRHALTAELARRRAAPRTTPRIGTWNIRWYPDGKPGKKAATPGTDIAWLACAIAWLDVDVLAVQEVKTLPRAQERTAELLRELEHFTGGPWRAAFDDCPQQATQHVGLLWNTARAELTHQRTEARLNPHGEPCRDSLRPGFVAEVAFRGGPRFQIGSVHFKSGTERRSLELREKSFAALSDVLASARARTPGVEMILAGDFNTMGCSSCSPKISAEEELASVRQRAEKAGFTWIATDPPCTEFYRDRGQLLDGFFVTSGGAHHVKGGARAAGLCGELGCQPGARVTQRAAVQRLSDHCPVVLDLSPE